MWALSLVLGLGVTTTTTTTKNSVSGALKPKVLWDAIFPGVSASSISAQQRTGCVMHIRAGDVLDDVNVVEGFNYNGGRSVRLTIYSGQR